MISDRRKLWLMCNLCVSFGTEKQVEEFADTFVNSLDDEEVEFCLSKLQRKGLK